MTAVRYEAKFRGVGRNGCFTFETRHQKSNVRFAPVPPVRGGLQSADPIGLVMAQFEPGQ